MLKCLQLLKSLRWEEFKYYLNGFYKLINAVLVLEAYRGTSIRTFGSTNDSQFTPHNCQLNLFPFEGGPRVS